MKKRFWSILTVLILSVFIATPVMAAMRDYQAAVYRWKGGYNSDGSAGLERVTSGITFTVLQKDSNTLETLYVFNDRKLTSMNNPVSLSNFASALYCNGYVQFRTDPGETNDRYVDLIVTDTNGGFTKVVKGFDMYNHNVIIDERPGILHHGVLAFWASTTDTIWGFNFLANTVVEKVYTEVITASAATIGMGSTGTSLGDAFKKAENMASTGYVVTSATSEGRSFASFLSLTGAPPAAGLPLGVAFSSATSFAYTCSTGSATYGGAANGYIHYWFSVGR